MGVCGDLTVERQLGHAADDEDERLVRAAVAGERGAFEALVSRHRRRMASVATRFLDEPQDIEDAVQETFLRAYQQLGSLRSGAGVRAWLISILVNVCRNKRRSFMR